MKIQSITKRSQLLDSVVKLGDQNRRYVGFFPKEGFRKSAERDLILCAVDERGQLQGYLLFYVARGRAVIQQLCVDSDMRKKGVGRSLVDEFKKRTSHLDGILVHCRRDFAGHQFWPQVGFIAVDERSGRGKKDTILTRYWYDHQNPDLFSGASWCVADTKVVAAMDANIVFDLQDTGNVINESVALQADWLKESVALKVTNEVFNEINRRGDRASRAKSRAFARKFALVEADPGAVEKSLKALGQILPKTKKSSDESDYRQLAMSIGGNAEFFITRDEDLLKHSDAIYNRFGITVADPTKLILQFDELLRKVDYQPARLGGCQVKIRRIGAGDMPKLANRFLRNRIGEKRGRFLKQLRVCLGEPKTSGGWLIEEKSEGMLGFVVINTGNERCLSVPFFRLKEGRLAATLARNLAMFLVKKSCAGKNKCSVTRVIDRSLEGYVAQALSETGFSKDGDAWVKITMSGMLDVEDVGLKIKNLCSSRQVGCGFAQSMIELLKESKGNAGSLELIMRAEQKLWPGKLRGAGMHNYIVPIQARWAMHLFDEELAKQDLFGATKNVALACENIYYRAKEPKVLEAPGRILWYVSKDRTYEGAMSVRACSSLLEVLVAKANELFKRFHQLGIYNWDDVIKTARHTADDEIMGFRFGATEIFRKPVSWEEIRTILKAHTGTCPPLSTPLRISENCFEAIYKIGILDE